MPEITSNVKFEHIAREWRCKFSEDNEKAALSAAQSALEEVLGKLSAVKGVISVQRVVCGGCFDFKVITKLSVASFQEWETSKFAPEADFLEALGKISGIDKIETQTYTLEEVKQSKSKDKAADKKAQKEANKEEVKKADAEKAKEEDPEAARKALVKKVKKEGGKRGVEIEGAADMGGLQFFCTMVELPDGDLDLLKTCVDAMNEKSDPTEEERKGGSGAIGKMVFSAGTEQLGVLAYVPEAKQGELNCEEWLKAVLANFGGSMIESGASVCTGVVKTDSDKNVFPLKIREPMILEANNFLRKKGLFPEDDGDSEEMVFGDDDFPSM